MSVSKLGLRNAVSSAMAQEAGIEFDPEEVRTLMEIFRIAESKFVLANDGPGSRSLDVLSGTPLQEAYHELLKSVCQVLQRDDLPPRLSADLAAALYNSLKVAI